MPASTPPTPSCKQLASAARRAPPPSLGLRRSIQTQRYMQPRHQAVQIYLVNSAKECSAGLPPCGKVPPAAAVVAAPHFKRRA